MYFHCGLLLGTLWPFPNPKLAILPKIETKKEVGEGGVGKNHKIPTMVQTKAKLTKLNLSILNTNTQNPINYSFCQGKAEKQFFLMNMWKTTCE